MLIPVSLLTAILLQVAGAAPAQAPAATQPQATPPQRVESVVVFGAAPPVLRDPVTGETRLSKEDLERVPAMTPDESLRVISGLSLFRRTSSRASNPTTHGVTMRGLSASGSSRALVMVDGLPLNEGFGGWVTWERLPSAAIDQISVQRGPAGDAFGSDALGGVIRFVTPSPQHASGSGSIEFGSLATETAALSGGTSRKGITVFGAASVFNTDGFVPLEAASRGVVDVPTDTYWWNTYGKAVFGSTHRLTLSGWGGKDDRGNGTVLQRNDGHGGTGTAEYDDAFGRTIVNARIAGSSSRYTQTFSSITTGRATEKLTSTQKIDTDTFRALGEVRRSFGATVAGAIRAGVSRTGATFAETKPTSQTSQDLHDNSQSLSAEIAAQPSSRLSLSAGLRGEWRAAGSVSSAAADKAATVGRGTAAFSVNRALTIRAAAASSHRWPTLNELVRDFAAGSTTTKANGDLLPERARSIETGIALSHGRGQLSLTAFRSIVHDAVANVTISSSPTSIVRQRRNAGDAHSAGVEIDGEWRSSMFRARASVTVLDAKFRNSQEAALEGNWLPQVPRTSTAFTADAFLPRHHVLSLIIHTSSSQFDDDRNQFLLAAGTQIDARLGGEFSGRAARLAWFVAAENIGDARIETGRTPLVALAQGRAFRVGLRVGK